MNFARWKTKNQGNLTPPEWQLLLDSPVMLILVAVPAGERYEGNP
jgi:hypothetical protein